MKPSKLVSCMVAAGCLTVAGATLAQPKAGSPTNPSAPAAAPADPGPGAGGKQQELAGDDEDFLESAAHAGYAEVESGKLAQEKAHSAEVKAFAKRMVEDHTKANQELAALAKRKDYTPPDGPALLQRVRLKALDLADDSFDRRYIDQFGVSAHEDTVELFEQASQHAEDADVKAFAAKTLPTLKEHLQMARTLQQQVGGDEGRQQEREQQRAGQPQGGQAPAQPGSPSQPGQSGSMNQPGQPGSANQPAQSGAAGQAGQQPAGK